MEFLAGLHPKVIHFPIAFFILYFIFETAGLVLKKEYLNKSAIIILALAVFFAVIAVLTGNQAHEMVKRIQIDTALYNEFIAKHELYSTITLWYFLALLIARTYLTVKKKFAGNVRYIFLLLGLIGSVLIYLTASFGGDLVFKYGIGTKLF